MMTIIDSDIKMVGNTCLKQTLMSRIRSPNGVIRAKFQSKRLWIPFRFTNVSNFWVLMPKYLLRNFFTKCKRIRIMSKNSA
jgi:hypothetical protein